MLTRPALALCTALTVCAPSIATSADLMSIYQAALVNDASFQIAVHQHAAAQRAVDIAKSAKRPTLSLSVTGSALNSSRSVRDEESTTAALAGSMPLYNRTNSLNVMSARVSAAQADADLDSAKQSLALRSAQLYFEVLRARDAVLFSRAELDAFARQLEQTEGRYEVGLVAITDVKEAQAGFDVAQAAVIAANNDLSTAVQALKVTVGDYPDDIATLRDDIPLEPPKPDRLGYWLMRAAGSSPQIRSSEQQRDAASVDLRLARAITSPTLDLAVSASRTGSDIDLNDNLTNRNVQLSLGVPLYTGGSRAARSGQARQLLSAAEQQLNLTRDEVERDVRNSFASVNSSISRVRALERALESSRSGLEATQAGFDAGTRTNVDVLDAIRAESDAKTQLSGARYDYVLGLLELYALAGQLGDEQIAQVDAWLTD